MYTCRKHTKNVLWIQTAVFLLCSKIVIVSELNATIDPNKVEYSDGRTKM